MRNDWSGHTFGHPAGRRPVVGDFGSIDRRRPLQNLVENFGHLGPIFEVRVFDQKFVFVTSAELADELNDESRFEKALSPALEGLRAFVGDGLFTAYNDEPHWRIAHELLLAAFSKQAMIGYHPVMLAAIDELFDYWDRALADNSDSGAATIDVAGDMTRLTMETIGRTAFSQDFGSFTRPDTHPFVEAMVTALRTGRQRGSLATIPGARWILKRLAKRNEDKLAPIEGFLADIVATRRASGDTSTHDLLGIMLHGALPATGERLSDENIGYQILTFLVAGHETTSGALTFALYFLARHPAALAKAQAETDAILGADPDARPEYDQVARFRYLRRVLDEALRLWPTAPGYARTPREETVLAGRYLMRPGDWALVMLPLVQRDPAVWGTDGAQFDPDRPRPKGAVTVKPFGVGERACIGRQFALHEAVLVLARVLHRYDIAADPSYRLEVSERLTVMPKGFRLTLTRRTPVPAPT